MASPLAIALDSSRWPYSTDARVNRLWDIRSLVSLNRLLLGLPAATLLIWLAFGASATAAVIETTPPDPDYPDSEPFGAIEYTGTASERNRLRVLRGGRGRLLFVDRGARRLVLRGPGCFHLSRRRAMCRPSDDTSFFYLRLGRGADRAVIESAFFRERGGLGVELSTFVFAGPGDDTVLARDRGPVELNGGSGDDRLKTARRARDSSIYGGRGDDSMAGHGSSIDGNAGDDYLRGKHLEGGGGDDRLVAERGGSLLEGGHGNDVLIGSADPSVLGRIPGAFSPSQYGGGPGNDRLVTVNGRAEETAVDCGGGRDRIRADRNDRLRRCERVMRVSR